MIGFVVEGEPDSRLARDGPGGVEVVGPFAPVVERFHRVAEVGHDQVLVAQLFGGVEAALPTDE